MSDPQKIGHIVKGETHGDKNMKLHRPLLNSAIMENPNELHKLRHTGEKNIKQINIYHLGGSLGLSGVQKLQHIYKLHVQEKHNK